MVAASGTSGSRVLVSRDGTLGGLVADGRVITVRLPALEQEAEIAVEEGADLAFVGDLPRLVVVSRTGAVQVLDPRGPQKIGDVQVEPGSRIVTTTPLHAVIGTPASAALVAVSSPPTLQRLPLRGAVQAAGGTDGADRFVVAVGGTLEEWSTELRAPLRRFRLDKPVAPRALGGNARTLWFVPDGGAPELALVSLGGARPAKIDLPEPAARIAADAERNQLAFIGAHTAAVFVINLADRSVRAVHAGPADDVAWVDLHSLLCSHRTSVELIPISVSKDAPAAEPPPELPTAQSASERLAAWREKARVQANAPVPEVRIAEPAPPAPAADHLTQHHEWRDVVAAWSRRCITVGRADPPLLAAGPLHDVALRAGLTPDQALVLWLVYGARLCGYDGVAPIDIANVSPHRWKDALGATPLAATSVLVWRRNRIDLLPEVAHALDELPPHFGTLAPSAVPVSAKIALVAPRDADLEGLGEWAASRVGEILVPNERGLNAWGHFLNEARIRGIAPLVPAWKQRNLLPDRVVMVVERAEEAHSLGVHTTLDWAS